jgi:hypothetical protein
MATMPEQGQPLPNVDFITESGERLASGDLGGQKTVLYFYPKDDTPGCTKEACAFRDRMVDYEGAGIRVYGVSLDSPESHRQFREKHNLNYPAPHRRERPRVRGAGSTRRPGLREARDLLTRLRREDRKGLPGGLSRDARRRDTRRRSLALRELFWNVGTWYR